MLDDIIFVSGHLRDVIFLELVLLRLIRLFIPSHVFFHISNIILKVLMIVSFLTQTSKDRYLISVVLIHIIITRVKK